MKLKIFLSGILSIVSVVLLVFFNNEKLKDTDEIYKKLITVKEFKEDYLKLRGDIFLGLKKGNLEDLNVIDKIEKLVSKYETLRKTLEPSSSQNIKQFLSKLKFDLANLKKHVEDLVYKNLYSYVRLINEMIIQNLKQNNIKNREFLEIAIDIALNATYMVFFDDPDYIRKLHDLKNQLNSKDWGEDSKLAKLLNNKLEELLTAFKDYHKDIKYISKEDKTLNHLETVEAIYKEDLEGTNLKYLYIEQFLMVVFLISAIYLFIKIIQLINNNDKLDEIMKRLNEALEIDDLTSLKNRYAFIKEKKSYKEPTLILINIDNFKHINDSYGSNVGDHILRELGKTLKKFLVIKGLNGEVYRLGADDFGLLIEGVRSKKKLEEIVNELINMIENSEFKYSGIEIPIKVTAGISYETPLLETADIALKHVKRSRNKYMFYSEDMNIRDRIVRNINTIRLIKNALNEDRIFLVFQPIKNLRTDEIDKFEVLVRLQDDRGRILYPGEFLDIAKEAKYYGEITKTVLEKTFKILKEHDITLSVNLSLEDIIDDNIRRLINKNIKNPKIGRNLIFEILEDESIENYQKEFQEFIKEMKEHDVRIAIDDFGSGYSNFSHLLKLKPDYIKVDGKLIKEIDVKEENRVITETIVEFAHKLDIETVAEFVWNNDVLRVVKEIGFENRL